MTNVRRAREKGDVRAKPVYMSQRQESARHGAGRLPGEAGPMAFEESDLEMARRHVADGERHVRDQHRIIAHLTELEADTGMAEQLLAEFEATLSEHRAHLNRLEIEAKGPRPA